MSTENFQPEKKVNSFLFLFSHISAEMKLCSVIDCLLNLFLQLLKLFQSFDIVIIIFVIKFLPGGMFLCSKFGCFLSYLLLFSSLQQKCAAKHSSRIF